MITLDKFQLDVVRAPLGKHIRVNASAGSGKSTTCCHRVKYLLESGVSPERIVVLMYNNKAEAEFQETLDSLIGSESKVKVRTYHKFAKRLLEALVAEGLVKQFSLVSNEFTLSNAKQRSFEAGLGEYAFEEKIDLEKLYNKYECYFSICKSSAFEINELTGFTPDEQNFCKLAYEDFEADRQKSSIKYFDDLIKDLYLSIVANEELKIVLANKIDYLILDEFQDINEVTFELLKTIAGTRANLLVVGDDDQTINEWRGSSPSFLITTFKTSYPDSISYNLTETYRYGHRVCLISGLCIQNNKDRVEKICTPSNSAPETKIQLKYYDPDVEYPAYCSKQSAIIETIFNHIKAGGQFSDIAILIRTNSFVHLIELALLKHGFPYSIESQNSVLRSREYKLICSLFDMYAAKQAGVLSVESIYNSLVFPLLFIKKNILEKVSRCIYHYHEDGIDKELAKITKSLKLGAKRRLNKRARAICEVLNGRFETPEQLLNTYFQRSMILQRSKFSQAEEKSRYKSIKVIEAIFYLLQENIGNLENVSSQLEFYFSIFSSNPDLNGSNSVNIVTCHASKGLAWPVVIVPGLVQGEFPKLSAKEESMNIDAERRLFFVAITRVRKLLVLLTANDTKLNEALENHVAQPFDDLAADSKQASQFVYETNFLLVNKLVDNITNSTCRLKAPSKFISPINSYLAETKNHLRIGAGDSEFY